MTLVNESNLNRQVLLQRLLSGDSDLDAISLALRPFGWDSEVELVTLERTDVARILHRFLLNRLSADVVRAWACMIEGRDDIGYEPLNERAIRDALFELANPLLTELLTRSSATRLAASLNP